MRAVLVLIALVAALSPAARAQEARAHAMLSSEQAIVGDAITLEIIVEGAEPDSPPSLPPMEGVDVQALPSQNQSSQSIEIFNGRRTERKSVRHSFPFRLTPRRAGDFEIPSVEVVVGGRRLRSAPVRFSARPPTENADFKVVLQPAKTEAWVGEPIPLRVTWYLGGSVSSFGFSNPSAGGAIELAAGPDPRIKSPHADPYTFVEFPFLGLNCVGVRGMGQLGERTFTTLTFDVILIPRQAGALTFGPLTLAFDVPSPSRGRRDDLFSSFLATPTRRMVIPSNEVGLAVRELPSQGRPAGFDGLVGEFSIEASASTPSVSVGDPIELTVRIRGPEPLDDARAPRLEADERFASGFRLSNEGWSRLTPSPDGTRDYRTTIRAATDAVTEIPPLRLPYFDSNRGEYRVARSAAIPLEVRPTRQLTSADAVSGSAAPAGSPRAMLGPGPGGLHANTESPSALVDRGQPGEGPLIGAGLVAAIVLPPALCSAAALARAQARRLDTRRHRRSRALARARRILAATPDAGRAAAAVRGYIGAAFGRDAASVTSHDCSRLLAPMAPDAAAVLREALAKGEHVRYGGADATTDPARILESIRRVEQSLKGVEA